MSKKNKLSTNVIIEKIRKDHNIEEIRRELEREIELEEPKAVERFAPFDWKHASKMYSPSEAQQKFFDGMNGEFARVFYEGVGNYNPRPTPKVDEDFENVIFE